ncbi:MAG: enoyl-CoA hydratase-related protein [Devosia sp.]
MGEVKTVHEGAIAHVVIDQQDRRNAMSQGMWQSLADAAHALTADSDARAVIVRGAGGTFCAGADMSEFETVYRDRETTAAYSRIVSLAQRALAAVPIPVIAAVEGNCFGGGCGIALAADLRFAATDARFAITPARIGAAYSFADTKQLVDVVGPARAKDILFSGRAVEATEALAIGLVDRLVEPGASLAAATDYVDHLATLSANSMRFTKATIEAIRKGATGADQAMEEAFLDTFAQADFREGYAAFLAKRKPQFS